LDLAEYNRLALHDDAALWGVPSFRVGELTTWGQDRLPLVAHALGLPG
jgi:2-hydroxychromene-2-carboxylate isomerase